MTFANTRRLTWALQPHDGVANGSSPTSRIRSDAENNLSVGLVVDDASRRGVFANRLVEADLGFPQTEGLREVPLRVDTVPLPVGSFYGQMQTIQIEVFDLNELTEEIVLAGNTIGFISRVCPIFVAETGSRVDRAEECGQFLVWDSAAALLISKLGQVPEPAQPGIRVRVHKQTTALSAGGARPFWPIDPTLRHA
ncbi:hypothetical protein [Frigoribacterium sp. UYMn621]|uniref:hypothetical protein n=1 Tax=Frigoribacterium sp. UYMn621 TaxID=3156343 RepID=UPI003391D81D